MPVSKSKLKETTLNKTSVTLVWLEQRHQKAVEVSFNIKPADSKKMKIRGSIMIQIAIPIRISFL